MEIMINSDNVVRGGLTPKLKDTATLCEILPYDSRSEPSVAQGCIKQDLNGVKILEYLDARFDELCLIQVSIVAGSSSAAELECLPLLSICIVIEGSGTISVQNETLGVQTQHTAPAFSTWYISPGSKLSLMAEHDQTFVVFIASPKA